MFNTITEKSLPGQVSAVISWCPSVDLVLFVPLTNDALWLHRLNGQRVWSVMSSGKVTRVIWKNDGKTIGIIYEDWSFRILSTSSGKELADSSQLNVSSAKWGKTTTIRDQLSASHIPFDFIDIDPLKALPRLQPMGNPHTQFNRILISDGNLPASSSLEVDMLVTGTVNGRLKVCLYGIFSIDDKALIDGYEGECTQLDSTEDLTQHMAVVNTGNTNDNRILFVSCRTNFVTKFAKSNYLYEISVIPATCLALVDYIDCALSFLQSETKSLQSGTKRILDVLLSKLPDDGEDHDDKNLAIISELYDALITGNPSEYLNNWLIELSDRGLKRWHKVCTMAYENSRKYLFENLIPSCERLILLLSRLRGLARWETGELLGLKPELFNEAINHVKFILQDSHRCIWDLGDEYEKFKGFMSWLEVTYDDVPGAPPATGKPINGEPAKVKTTDVIKYVTTYLTSTRLEIYFTQKQSLQMSENKDDLVDKARILKSCLQDAFKLIKSALADEIEVGDVIYLAPQNQGSNVMLRYNETDQICYATIFIQSQTKFTVIRYNLASKAFEGVVVECESIIQQVEYVDDFELMVLLEGTLVALNYSGLSYQKLEPSSKSLQELTEEGTTPEKLRSTKLLQFENDFSAVSFAVNGHKSRRVGCVLHKDFKKYRFFDLDEEEGYDDDDEDDHEKENGD